MWLGLKFSEKLVEIAFWCHVPHGLGLIGCQIGFANTDWLTSWTTTRKMKQVCVQLSEFASKPTAVDDEKSVVLCLVGNKEVHILSWQSDSVWTGRVESNQITGLIASLPRVTDCLEFTSLMGSKRLSLGRRGQFPLGPHKKKDWFVM